MWYVGLDIHQLWVCVTLERVVAKNCGHTPFEI